MKIYISNTDFIAQNPDFYASFLPAKHRARALKFKSEIRKNQFILGHLMAVACGKKHTSIACADNIVVVAAASDAPVGISIKNTKSKIDATAVSQKLNLPESTTLNDFFRNFTYTEACFRLGITPHSRIFMRHGDYIICAASRHRFTFPKLTKFDPNSVCFK